MDVDELMNKAFGATLLRSDGGCRKGLWCSRQVRIIQHSNKQYVLPGGSISRKYVDLLAEEVQQLADGNFPSKRVIVFSSVMLQHDRVIKKGSDI